MIPVRIRKKGEKIALAHEYVHDRIFFVPSYGQIIRNFMIDIGLILLFAIISVLVYILVPRIVAEIQTWKPKPAPPVEVGQVLRGFQAEVQARAQTEWEFAVSLAPSRATNQIHQIPRFVEMYPDIFRTPFKLNMENIRTYQYDAAHPFAGFTFKAASHLRFFVSQFASGEESAPSQLDAQIALLKEISNFNQIDIRSYLNSSVDRAAAMREYLIRAENLQESGLRVFYNISARRVAAENTDERLQQAANAQEGAFVENLDRFLTQKTEETFLNFVATKQQTVEARANAGLLRALEVRYERQLRLLGQRTDAIELNREALVANVQITPVSGIDLGLIAN